MTAAEPQSVQTSDVFDRILGRKGDDVRLEPAIRSAEKNLAPEFQRAVEAAGLELEVAFEERAPTTVDALFSEKKGGTVCCLLGNAGKNPLAYMKFDFAAAGIIGEIMLGANPELPLVPLKRAPTALEKNLIGHFAGIAGKALQAAVATPKCPAFLRLTTSLEDLRDSGDQTLIGFDVTLTFGTAQARVTLALSHQYLLQMERRVNPVRKPAGSAEKPRNNPKAMSVAVPVEGSVSLDAVSLQDLAFLKPGDVLAFPESDANVRLKVKGRPVYECSLGRKGANYALSLHRPHKALTEALNGLGVPTHNANDEEPHNG